MYHIYTNKRIYLYTFAYCTGCLKCNCHSSIFTQAPRIQLGTKINSYAMNHCPCTACLNNAELDPTTQNYPAPQLCTAPATPSCGLSNGWLLQRPRKPCSLWKDGDSWELSPVMMEGQVTALSLLRCWNTFRHSWIYTHRALLCSLLPGKSAPSSAGIQAFKTPKSWPCYQQWKLCNPNPESVMSGFAWGETNPTSLLHSSAAAISHIFGLTAKCTCKNTRLQKFYDSFTLKSFSIL